MSDERESYEQNRVPATIEDAAVSAGVNKPLVALVAAGVIGLAVGAIVMKRRSPQKFAAAERAIDLARTGTYRTFSNLKRRLRDEGYVPDHIERRTRRYIGDLLHQAANRIGRV